MEGGDISNWVQVIRLSQAINNRIYISIGENRLLGVECWGGGVTGMGCSAALVTEQSEFKKIYRPNFELSYLSQT